MLRVGRVALELLAEGELKRRITLLLEPRHLDLLPLDDAVLLDKATVPHGERPILRLEFALMCGDDTSLLGELRIPLRDHRVARGEVGRKA